MASYERGFAATEQIRLAWPHRNSHDRPLSFAPGRGAKIQLGVAIIHMALCLLAGAGLAVLALVPPWQASGVSTAGTAVCFFALGSLACHFHRSLLVANGLAEREREQTTGGDAR